MTPRVLHVVVAGEVGGAERMLVDLARGRPEHAVALLTPSDRLRALFRDAELVVMDRGPVREGPLRYLRQAFGRRDVAWLRGTIARHEAAIVHLHTFASQVIGTRAARRAGAKIVRTEHSTRVYDDPSCWPFSRWSLARVDAAVCISKHVADVAGRRAPWARSRLRVVPNGVDVHHFAESPRPPKTSALRFIALGRLDPRKGLDAALAALARVPQATLDVVGDGGERNALVALAARLGVADRVRFVGWLADVRAAIANADVALSSARAEGLGIALLEAMAVGRAVVALPTGGVPEIVTDGETGWLAQGRDAHALARVMRDAVERRDEVERRGARAREAVVARFSVEAMRQGYDDVYRALV